MREHLYRGKFVENGEWCYGDLIRHSGVPYISLDGYGLEVKPETVGQYTGRKDSSGVKIFEADILQGTLQLSVIERTTEKFRHVVIFEYGRFYALQENLFDKFVIGNIHDNPELLEVNND